LIKSPKLAQHFPHPLHVNATILSNEGLGGDGDKCIPV
jgi:hypothetical protein